MPKYVVIKPRDGVRVDRLEAWLLDNFQSLSTPLNPDGGPSAKPMMVPIKRGNPLINAKISIVEMP